MAKVMINETTLASIGDAIRNKIGATAKYKPSEMPAAINAIKTGGGAGLDFSKLQYAEVTRATTGTLPNLSQFTTDFSKVYLLCWNYGRSTSGGATYLYLKGTDSDRSARHDLFYFGSNYESTPTDSRTNYFVMDASNMGAIQVYQNGTETPLTNCFKGTLIMFYEEG